MKKLSLLLAVLMLCTTLAACTEPQTNGGTTTIAASTTTTTEAPVITTTDAVTTTAPSAESTTAGETPTTVVNIATTVATPTTTTTTVTPTTVPTTRATLSSADDRAWQENPGSVYEPKNSAYDAQANAIKAAVNAAKDTLKPAPGGKAIYISEHNGDDNNDGLSPATAFRTVNAIRYGRVTLNAGDVVLFERGGLYRLPTALQLLSGVSYGAYGTGDRPLLYGSSRNYAKDTWTQVEPNIWVLEAGMANDVGCVVFNHGEKWAQWVETKAELDKEMEFFSDTKMGNCLYLYTTVNPNGAYRSIEIGHDGRLFSFDGKTDITIENLTFKYTGGHAVRGGSTARITVRGCEFGFIGGSILHYNGSTPVRYGNAVEFIGSSHTSLVENCWFYQIYDSATTCQGDGTSTGFTLRGCLSEYVGMGTYEYWGVPHYDTLIENNVMRWAGYGHGGIKGENGVLRAHIQSNAKPGNKGGVRLNNFVVRNNIFDQSSFQLINFCYHKESTVTVDGNTYAQVKDNRRRPFGYMGNDTTQYMFDDAIAENIKTVLGDQNATVVFTK